MRRAALAGFAAGAAMMIGGALGAVSNIDPKPLPDADAEVMNPMIGGQAMLPDRDIMENMAASPMHTTFVNDLKDTGVAGALKANGEFTVFAPTNQAFAAMGPQPKASLARRMSYLIVPGKYDSQALLRVINEAGGQAKLRTAEGGTLIARMNGPTNIALMDERGNTADIAIYDVHDKNGIVHVVDRMLEPGGSPRQVASN
jgi:uncharacterized surface protein with fasciclin (FAS1) repeats